MASAELPQLTGDRMFITDGGLETDLIYHHGLDLPCFAAFTLLADEHGVAALREYYGRYLEIARRHKVGMLLDTVTWRANRDWGERLGYSPDELDAARSCARRSRTWTRAATRCPRTTWSTARIRRTSPTRSKTRDRGSSGSAGCGPTRRRRATRSSTSPTSSTRAIRRTSRPSIARCSTASPTSPCSEAAAAQTTATWPPCVRRASRLSPRRVSPLSRTIHDRSSKCR